MSKQAAGHHKKAARNERPMRHAKRVRGGKPTATKKSFARRTQVVTGAEQPQSSTVPNAYANPAPKAVEVLEIEMVVPEEPMDVLEAEFESPENPLFDEDESDPGW